MAGNLDIGTIINKKEIAASHIYQMMLDANVHNVRFLMTADADIAEFIPVEGAKITRKKVKDLSLPVGMTLGGLVRNGLDAGTALFVAHFKVRRKVNGVVDGDA